MTEYSRVAYANCTGCQAGSFYDGSAGYLFMGHDTGVGDTALQYGWIAFEPDLPQGLQILSGLLYFYAHSTRADEIYMNVGCEYADDPSEPVSAADVRGREMTSSYSYYEPSGYTAGGLYHVDITSAIQQILNRPGWAPGNTMAVLYESLTTGSNDRRRLMESWQGSYGRPYLWFSYTSGAAQVILL